MPSVGQLAAAWLLLDLVALARLRDASRTSRIATLAGQAVALPCFGLAVFTSEPISSIALWLMFGAVNSSLGAVGMQRQALLAIAGLLVTAVALVLAFLGSFASFAVIAAGAVFGLASAVFPTGPEIGRRTIRSPLSGT